MNETRQKALTDFLAYRLGKKAVKRIQSGSDREMYYEVTEAALFMATAGFLDEGNQLLQCLWQFKWPHIEDCWLPDQAFEVLWHINGERPLEVPFQKKPIDVIELDHRRYMTIDRWFQLPMSSGSIDTLHGHDLMRRCLQLANPTDEGDSLPTSSQERVALKGLERLFAESGDTDPDHGGNNLVLAAELAARNGLSAQAIECAMLWAANYPERWLGCNFPTMASNRHVAPLLLKGIFAEPFGLTATSCQSYLRSLIAAVEARMKRGRKLIYGKWTWDRLLAAVSKRAIQAQPDLFTKEQRKSRWLGCPAASEETILAVEARLSLRLPRDYVAFLRASNGLPVLSTTTAPLRAVERIGRFVVEADGDFMAILKEYPDASSPEAFEHSIQISDLGEMGGELVLLIPPTQTGEDWQTWFYAPWVPGTIRYPSFRHYFEQVFQDLQTE